MTTFSETALPTLVFTLPAGHPLGNVAATGDLTITDAQGIDQQWLVWGRETNEFYDITASSAALFYEAEGRTLMSGSTVVTTAGSSGGGTNNAIESASLPALDTPVWSTQLTGGGAHLSHVGSFRVFARVMNTAATTGSVTVSLEWASGDFARYTRNTATTLDSSGADAWRIVDLGIVSIPVLTGVQRWEGRLIAQASATDKIRLDCIFLVPIDRGSGEATATAQGPATAAPTGFDSFDQTAGALVGKVAPTGGTWTFGSGDTDDWTVDATNHIITRSASSDTAPRLVTLGTTNYTDLVAQIDMRRNSTSTLSCDTGLLLRHVSSTAYWRVSAGTTNVLVVAKKVGAAVTLIGTPVITWGSGAWYTLTVSISASGVLKAWWLPKGTTLGTPLITVSDALLATGGANASGQVGLYESNTTHPGARDIDNFLLTTPTGAAGTDVVMFANRSLVISDDGVRRQDSAGTLLQNVGGYEGDLLKLDPTGREQRLTRFIVKASRSVPGTGSDAGIDDINATLTYVPRYWSVPKPA